MKLLLRPVETTDAELLLLWRNDEQTRKSSHNTDFVSYKSHTSWLSKSLVNPNRILCIAELSHKPIGTVRADYLPDLGEWELSWTISPDYRGQGFGKGMLEFFSKRFEEPIIAEVKSLNISSIKIAEHIGMKIVKEVDNVLYFRRD